MQKKGKKVLQTLGLVVDLQPLPERETLNSETNELNGMCKTLIYREI